MLISKWIGILLWFGSDGPTCQQFQTDVLNNPHQGAVVDITLTMF